MLVRFMSKLEKWLLPGKNHQTLVMRGYSKAPVVTVEQGQMKGSIAKLVDGSSYYSFKGIPYAQPPIGTLRFKAPLPPKPWNGIHDATEHRSVCPQMDMITTQVLEGNEDCLFLNVYSKSLKDDRKPVMVFVHGGAFMSGSGDSDLCGPEHLIQHDIVLVTLNYRLEVLGFLCLDTEEVPGNAGMKDQVLALKWVKKNIANFGGDPDNVTLFGESAGGSSVTYHMVSPMAKNLFHKAIAQSGVCFSDWSVAVGAKERAFRVGKLLGKDTNDTDELLNFLQSVPAVALVKTTFKTMLPEEKIRGLPMHFVPIVEKKFPNVEAYLNEDSINLLLAKNVQDVPLLLGYNNGEGMPMLSDFLKKIAIFNKELELKIPREITNRVSKEKLQGFGDKIRQFYFKGKELSTDMKVEMANLHTDIYFVYNIIRFANLFLAAAKSPVFMYRFGYESELNIMKSVSGMTEMKGASHADDLFYLFSNDMTKELIDDNEKLRDMINVITKLWTNFAKTGNPTPDNSLGVQWKPFTNKSKCYLNIEKPLSLDLNPDQERIEFWNKLYSESGLPCITKSNL